MRHILRWVAALALSLGVGPRIVDAQSVDRITATGLGFPVPLPVDSLTPVAGYRSYASLRMRFDDLWMRNDSIERLETGHSVRGRAIYSYRFTSAGDRTPEGLLKSAALIDGTLHAREWQSPEVTAALFERLALSGEDPVARYLLDHMVIVIHPLANPDGLVQSQSYPDMTVDGGPDGGGNDATGRDGRMRRKNMRDADDDLDTLDDYLLGVNLNGNFDIAFGQGRPASHRDPANLAYIGPEPASEPETRALLSAADAARVGGENRLRYYMDFHSYGQEYYVALVDEVSRNTVAERVYALMRDTTRATTGVTYTRNCAHVEGRFGCDPAGGVSDTFFAGTLGCVSYTCEIRPPAGAPGANGFILADAAIDDVRREIVPATMAALLYMSGPPVLTEVSVYAEGELSLEDPAAIYRERRSYDEASGAREVEILADGALRPGESYSAVLRFNKPMRLLNEATGEAEPFVASTGTLVQVELGSSHVGTNARWAFSSWGEADGFDLYPGDTLIVDLAPTATADCAEPQTLSVNVRDLVGQRLDANPLTVVDWGPAGWTSYEDGRGAPSSLGGPDTTTRLRMACAPRFRRADCNDDGNVDVTDALCLLNSLFGDGPALGCLVRANANGDGKVDISDVVFTLSFLFGDGAAPDAPFPECGDDLTEGDGELSCESSSRSC